MNGIAKLALFLSVFSGIAQALPTDTTAAPSAGGEQAESTAQLRAFADAKGVLMIRSFESVGEVMGLYGAMVEVEVCRIFEPISSKKLLGLRIEITNVEEKSKIGFIDFDEIPGLLGGITYILSFNPASQPLPVWEAMYRTKDDIRLSVFNSETRNERTATIEIYGFPRMSIYLNTDGLTRLRDLVTKGFEKLKTL